MEFLKKLWNWLLGQTTVDEKIEAKVVEVKKDQFIYIFLFNSV